jgi:adenine-specific DNA methylase
MGEQMVAVITEDTGSKRYRPVEETDLKAFRKASEIPAERPQELILPEVNAEGADDDVSNSTGIRVHLYGMKTWGSLFNQRQLVAMQTFVSCLHEALAAVKKEIKDAEYRKAVGVYLGLWVSRSSMFQSNVGLWKPSGEFVAAPFSMQAIPMVWDYPETSLFADTSGGGRRPT